MIRARLGQSIGAEKVAAALAVALGVMSWSTNARAQIIEIGPPSSQFIDYPSLESQVLDRLSLGGQYQPQDLSDLARLTVLESIALFARVHADMAGSPMGDQLEAQAGVLWQAAQACDESVSSIPLDVPTFTRANAWFGEVAAAQARLDSTLGAFPGLSHRAAAHLSDITRLTAATGSVMEGVEEELLSAVLPPTERSPELDGLKRAARLLANDIVGLIANVKRSKHEGLGWEGVLRELGELFALVGSFEETLAQPWSNNEIESSFRAVRRRTWRVEAGIARLGWPTDLARMWRGVRERQNVISDGLGLPRVIDLAARAAADEPRASGSVERPRTRIYRGPPR